MPVLCMSLKAKNLPVSFYSPTLGFNVHKMCINECTLNLCYSIYTFTMRLTYVWQAFKKGMFYACCTFYCVFESSLVKCVISYVKYVIKCLWLNIKKYFFGLWAEASPDCCIPQRSWAGIFHNLNKFHCSVQEHHRLVVVVLGQSFSLPS